MAVLSYSMGRGCRSLGMFRNLRSSLRTRRALGGGTAHRLREMRTDLSIRAAATDRNTRYIMAEAAFASLVVQLSDNGRGMTQPLDLAQLTDQKHFGLVGISERVSLLGGTLNLTSMPHGGLKMEIEIPSPYPTVGA